MKPLWVLSPLLLAAALAVLSLEVIGIPLMVLALLMLILISRRSGQLPVMLIAFGLGFSATVGFFAIFTSGLTSGSSTATGTIWFAFWFAFGTALLVAGAWLHLRRMQPDTRSP